MLHACPNDRSIKNRFANLSRSSRTAPRRQYFLSLQGSVYKLGATFLIRHTPRTRRISHRMSEGALRGRGQAIFAPTLLLAAVLLQVFTPFPVLTWLGELTKMLIGD